MKRKLLIPILVISLAALMVRATISRSSSGAPASHTGAPGEKTCTEIGCHDDTQTNIGTARLSLEMGNNEKVYTPGQTYPIRIKITDPGVNRFGFQVVALESKTQKNLGSFQISDSARTQEVTNQYRHKERRYVTYTFDGTDAVKEGYGEWTVNWTAPADASKPVTFYLAAVSGNDDMSDKGDKVYTAKYTFKQTGSK
jgi:hypothetical protein